MKLFLTFFALASSVSLGLLSTEARQEEQRFQASFFETKQPVQVSSDTGDRVYRLKDAVYLPMARPLSDVDAGTLSSWKPSKNTPKPSPQTRTDVYIGPTCVSGITPAEDVTLNYNGGRLLTSTVNIYAIWYGNWNKTDSTIRSMENFLRNIKKDPNFKLMGSYVPSLKPTVNFKGSSYDNGYFGLNVTSTSSERDTMIETIINNVALKRKIPVDDSSLFLFLASPEIRNEGFCEDYCGYHSYFEHIIQANEVLAKKKAVGSKTYPTYAFIGSGCDLDCGPAAIFSTPAPINYALDQMSTVVSHEIVEIISDPEPGSGFVENISGEENADLCVYCYNHVYRDKNGAYYNFFVGNDKFMLQANYDAINKQCV
jgi:hypothetical protein